MENYLYHSPKLDHLVGLLHNRKNLFALLMEAKFLQRVAVIPSLHLNGKHNDDRDSTTEWARYIDIERYRAFTPLVFASDMDLSSFEAETVDEEAEPRDLVDESKQLLIRKHERYPNYYRLIGILDNSEWEKQLEDLWAPSSAVDDAANVVREALGEYACIHVRRGDKLGWKQCPGLDRATQPGAIRKFLKGRIPDGGNLYIMSNEWTPGFFDPLKADYRIYTFRDFPQLVRLRDEDNYFLFCVENEIMGGANPRIKTFKEAGFLSLLEYPPNGIELFSSKIRRRVRRLCRMLGV